MQLTCFTSNQENWNIWTKVLNPRYPFVLNVLKGALVLYGVTEKEDVGTEVRQGAFSIAFLLIQHKRSLSYKINQFRIRIFPPFAPFLIVGDAYFSWISVYYMYDILTCKSIFCVSFTCMIWMALLNKRYVCLHVLSLSFVMNKLCIMNGCLTDTHPLCCIPEFQTFPVAVHHHSVDVVVENRGGVLWREGVGGIGQEEAGLAHASVPHDKELKVLHGAQSCKSSWSFTNFNSKLVKVPHYTLK